MAWFRASELWALLVRARVIGSSTQAYWQTLPISPSASTVGEVGEGQHRKPNFPNLNVWWDKGKLKLKDLCRKFSKQQANINSEKQREFEKALHELMNEPKSGDTLQQIGKIQQELGMIHNKWVLGAKIRSKEKFYHDDKKPTKYFLNLENHRQSQKSISGLVDEQGVRHSTHKDVMKHIADFYEDLYTFEPTNAKAQETLHHQQTSPRGGQRWPRGPSDLG